MFVSWEENKFSIMFNVLTNLVLFATQLFLINVIFDSQCVTLKVVIDFNSSVQIHGATGISNIAYT